MYEVEIDRSTCKGCGACTKASQILFLDDDGLINMKGGVIADDSVEGLIRNIYDVKNSASVCPTQSIHLFDDDTGDEIEIERHSLIHTEGVENDDDK